MNHDELQKLREEHNRAQQSVYRVLGNDVVSGGVVFRKETVEMEDEDGLRVIEWFETRTCGSCGGVIDQKNTLLGVCAVCNRTVCSAKGCSQRCQKCGVLLCREDARVYGKNNDQVFLQTSFLFLLAQKDFSVRRCYVDSNYLCDFACHWSDTASRSRKLAILSACGYRCNCRLGIGEICLRSLSRFLVGFLGVGCHTGIFARSNMQIMAR